MYVHGETTAAPKIWANIHLYIYISLCSTVLAGGLTKGKPRLLAQILSTSSLNIFFFFLIFFFHIVHGFAYSLSLSYGKTHRLTPTILFHFYLLFSPSPFLFPSFSFFFLLVSVEMKILLHSFGHCQAHCGVWDGNSFSSSSFHAGSTFIVGSLPFIVIKKNSPQSTSSFERNDNKIEWKHKYLDKTFTKLLQVDSLLKLLRSLTLYERSL